MRNIDLYKYLSAAFVSSQHLAYSRSATRYQATFAKTHLLKLKLGERLHDTILHTILEFQRLSRHTRSAPPSILLAATSFPYIGDFEFSRPDPTDP